MIAAAAFAAREFSRPFPWAYAHGYLLSPPSRLTGITGLSPGGTSFNNLFECMLRTAVRGAN